MQHPSSRRQFLREVGKGTLVATIGPALASELGIRTAHTEPASTAREPGHEHAHLPDPCCLADGA